MINSLVRKVIFISVFILASCSSDESSNPTVEPDPTTIITPVPIIDPNLWKSISAGEFFSLGVKEDGSLWAWGLNDTGQLGDGTSTSRSVPVRIGTENNWSFVACGENSSFAIKSTGSLYAWGSNDSGQLGVGSGNVRLQPTRVGTDSNWKTVSSGREHTLALKTDGSLWSWGRNIAGQLGLNLSVFSGKSNPTRVGLDNNWLTIDAGYLHSLAIKNNGTLWAWGSDSYNQLGNGIQEGDFTIPIQIGTGTNWKIVSAGEQHSVALKTDGTLWAWGNNDDYQLGDGTTNPKISPYQLGTATNWFNISAGYKHTLAIKADKSLWSWGDNLYGRLGYSISGSGDGSLPTKVSNDLNWNLISAGGSHSLTLKNDKKLWVCGNNENGQLGDGTVTNRSVFKNIQ
jgi:alpha-tubulin suppressor-like RCC1 family protein